MIKPFRTQQREIEQRPVAAASSFLRIARDKTNRDEVSRRRQNGRPKYEEMPGLDRGNGNATESQAGHRRQADHDDDQNAHVRGVNRGPAQWFLQGHSIKQPALREQCASARSSRSNLKSAGQLPPSSFERAAAARTAFITAARTPPFSSWCNPSIVVPPGLVTMSLSGPGC